MIHVHWGWVVFCVWVAVTVPLFVSAERDTGVMRGLPQMIFVLLWTCFILAVSLVLKVFL